MRQFADRLATSIRQYAELPAADNAALYGLSSDVYSPSCGFRCMCSQRWTNANIEWMNHYYITNWRNYVLIVTEGRLMLLICIECMHLLLFRPRFNVSLGYQYDISVRNSLCNSGLNFISFSEIN